MRVYVGLTVSIPSALYIYEHGFQDQGLYEPQDGVLFYEYPEPEGGDIEVSLEIPEDVFRAYGGARGAAVIPADVANRYGPPQFHLYIDYERHWEFAMASRSDLLRKLAPLKAKLAPLEAKPPSERSHTHQYFVELYQERIARYRDALSLLDQVGWTNVQPTRTEILTYRRELLRCWRRYKEDEDCSIDLKYLRKGIRTMNRLLRRR